MIKTVLVVGAAGGIGMEVARSLVARGDTVIATVLDEAQAAQLNSQVPGIARIEAVQLDDADAVGLRIGRILADLDRLDQVAICAAVGPIGPTELASIASIRKVLEINTLSNVAIFQAVIGALRESKGHLLAITSMSGKIAMPFLGAYTASKYALEGLLDVIRQEVAGDGVRVSMIEPGGVKTPMVKDQIALVRKLESELTPELAARYGHLYRGFNAAASAGYDGQGGGSTPEQVASIVVEALNADTPETRYIVGEDAQQLLGARAAMGDREIDGMLAQFFAGS